MGNKYSIAFRGEVAEGFTVSEVRANFAEGLQKGDDIIDRLFSGKFVTLAKNLGWEQANSVAATLMKFGAVLYLVDGNGRAVKARTAIDQSAAAPEAPATETPSASDDESASKDPYDLTATAKVRHLEQITEPQTVMGLLPEDKGKARLRYRFDTFMAKGGGSIFKALTAVFLGAFLLIGLLRGVLLLVFPEVGQQHAELDFWGNLYITFLEITDPGNMAQDIYSSVAYKTFAVLAGIAGIVMLSALIAFITTALDQKIYELKRGRSKVIETDHTLILGWSEQRIIEIVRELTIANESERERCLHRDSRRS